MKIFNKTAILDLIVKKRWQWHGFVLFDAIW